MNFVNIENKNDHFPEEIYAGIKMPDRKCPEKYFKIEQLLSELETLELKLKALKNLGITRIVQSLNETNLLLVEDLNKEIQRASLAELLLRTLIDNSFGEHSTIYENIIKVIRGISNNTDSSQDPFKQLGNFTTYDSLKSKLDTLTYDNLVIGANCGFFRAKLNLREVEIKNIPLHANNLMLVISGMFAVKDGNLITSDLSYTIAFRCHNGTSWSKWMDYLDNPNSRISALEEYVDKIDLSELDNIVTTENDFLHAIQNKKEYAVIQNFDTLGDVVVGRLTMISDNMHHIISQIFTTHFLLNEDGTLSTSHNHNKIFIYHRFKYIGDLTTWSAWEEYNKENETTDSNQTKIIAQHDTLLNPMTLTLNGGGLYEKGTTQTINLTWSAMKGNSPITPVSLLEIWVNDDAIPVEAVSYSEQITKSKQFKVLAKFRYDVLGETVTISDTKYASATFVGAMWFGFSEYDTMSEIDMTTGTFLKQPLKTSPSGTYTFNNPTNGYLWLCIPDNMTINKVTMGGFDVPVIEINDGGVPGYRNFRSDNELVAGNYTIVIS